MYTGDKKWIIVLMILNMQFLSVTISIKQIRKIIKCIKELIEEEGQWLL